MPILLRIVLAFPMAFFVAGAVVFPVLEPYYGGRIALSLGVIAVLNGVESVVRLGHITTCGLVGSCGEHSVRFAGFLLWIAIVAFWRPRGTETAQTARATRTARTSHEDTLRRHAEGSSDPLAAFGTVLGVVALVVVGAFVAFAQAVGSHRSANAAGEPVVSSLGEAARPPGSARPALPTGETRTVRRLAGASDRAALLCDGDVRRSAVGATADACPPEGNTIACTDPMPIACVEAETGAVAVTAPVPGTELGSWLAASDRCRAAHGSGWTMARPRPAGSARLEGRFRGDAPEGARVWVGSVEPQANCWDRR